MSRTRSITLTLGSVAAGAILATGVTGLALADDQSVSPGAAGSTAGVADARTPGDRPMDGRRGGPGHRGEDGMPGMPGMRGGLMGEALHGETVVKADDGTISTIRQVRGTVTAVSTTSITVEAEDGYTATFAITSDTEVRVGLPQRGADPSTATNAIGDVAVGNLAHVHGAVSGSTATASRVMAMTAEQAAELEARRAEHAARHQALSDGNAAATQAG